MVHSVALSRGGPLRVVGGVEEPVEDAAGEGFTHALADQGVGHLQGRAPAA